MYYDSSEECHENEYQTLLDFFNRISVTILIMNAVIEEVNAKQSSACQKLFAHIEFLGSN